MKKAHKYNLLIDRDWKSRFKANFVVFTIIEKQNKSLKLNPGPAGHLLTSAKNKQNSSFDKMLFNNVETATNNKLKNDV